MLAGLCPHRFLQGGLVTLVLDPRHQFTLISLHKTCTSLKNHRNRGAGAVGAGVFAVLRAPRPKMMWCYRFMPASITRLTSLHQWGDQIVIASWHCLYLKRVHNARVLMSPALERWPSLSQTMASAFGGIGLLEWKGSLDSFRRGIFAVNIWFVAPVTLVATAATHGKILPTALITANRG